MLLTITNFQKMHGSKELRGDGDGNLAIVRANVLPDIMCDYFLIKNFE